MKKLKEVFTKRFFNRVNSFNHTNKSDKIKNILGDEQYKNFINGKNYTYSSKINPSKLFNKH